MSTPTPGQLPNKTIPAPLAEATERTSLSQISATPSVPPQIQTIAWILIVACILVAMVVYWRKFRTFKQQYAAISERIDGHIKTRTDSSPSPGHTYAIASRGPGHARDAEMQSAEVRWRHLSMAFPHLDDRNRKRPLILVTREYTEVPEVSQMQSWLGARISNEARRTGREVKSPDWIKEMGDNFDALRHPQLAIANPAIYTFPFFLTWQRRHQWGVLPYGVHNRIGVVCTSRHPKLDVLRQIEGRYGAALQAARTDKVALWVNGPEHAEWLPQLLCAADPGAPEAATRQADAIAPQIFSVGAYLHKELLPLVCAVISNTEAGAQYAELANEVEVTAFPDLIAEGPDAWADGSAIIVDLAVLPDGLEASGWEVLRLAHCVYVPIGIGYSVATVPFLMEEGEWRNSMLKDAGDALSPAAAALSRIGIELDERLWTAR